MRASRFPRFPVLLFIAAFVLRLAVIAWQHPQAETIFTSLNDSTDYDFLAQRLMEGSYTSPGGVPTAFRPPGYPAFLALVYTFAGRGNVMAVVLIQAFLGAFAAVMAWHLAKRLYESSMAAILAGCGIALYPPFLLQSAQILSEELSRVLMFGMLMLLWDGVEKRRPYKVLGAGVAFGALILTKSVVAATVPFLALAVAWWWKDSPRSRALAVAAFLLPAMAITGLWTTRNAVVSGGELIPVSTNFPITFTQGVTRFSYYTNQWYGADRLMPAPDNYLELTQMRAYNGIPDEMAVGREYMERARAFIGERRAWFAAMTVRKALHFWNPWVRNSPAIQFIGLLTMAPVILLGWLGIFIGLRRGGAARTFAVIALAIAIPITIPYAISQPDVRYRTSLIDPIWIILAGNSVAVLAERFLSSASPDSTAEPR